MQKIALQNTVVSPVASTETPGTPGWFTDGVPPGTGPTEVGADWFNAVQKELVAIVEASGQTLDTTGTFNAQVLAALCGAFAVVSATGSGSMGFLNSFWTRMLAASSASDCGGTNTAIVGSAASVIDPAAFECTVQASVSATVNGSHCSAIASATAATGESSTNCLVAASVNGTIGASADSCALLATAACSIHASDLRCAIVGAESCVVSAFSQKCVVLGSLNCETGAKAFTVMGGYSASTLTPSGSAQNQTWRIYSADGSSYWDGTSNNSGADYAEMFKNVVAGVIPIGSLVARSGAGVRVAQSGDRLLGVVSAAPSVLGNSGAVAWSGRNKRDEFGAVVMELDKNKVLAPVRNPDFDPSKPYTPRAERPAEWTAVGLLGQLPVRVDATVVVDCDVVSGKDGVGTAGDNKRGAQLECMEILSPFDAARGYGVALCMVR